MTAVGLQQGSANASGGDSDAYCSPNCCCYPQQQIFAPEIGPCCNRTTRCPPRSDYPNHRPEDCADQQSHWVRTRVCNWCTQEQQSRGGYDNSDQPRNSALSTAAQQHDDQRHHTNRRWWNESGEWSCEEDSSPVPTWPTSNRC